MGSIFSTPKVGEPIIVAPPPGAGEGGYTRAEEAAARETERIRRKRKMAGTVITGPQGLEAPPTTLKEKLGQ